MKYILEMPPVIRTGRSRLISPNKLENALTALTEMYSYQRFREELIIDRASQDQLQACVRNYDIARSAALALGVDVTNFPKHLKPYSGGNN